ncbi:MAG: DUF4445 domain-containing protein [Anaerolineae bacterium]|nr:DUF4445 domain-containing protein [Anaerolineae bacterium]
MKRDARTWRFHVSRITYLREVCFIATYTVRFQPLDRVVQVPAGTLVADAATSAGIELGLPCGGQGRCGRCTVIVRDGDVHRPPNRRFSSDDLAAGYALACQATIQGDAVIYVPPQKIERELSTDKTARRVQAPFAYDYLRDQPLRKYVVMVTEPSLDDQTDDWSRLKRELARQHGVETLSAGLSALRRLSAALREGDWTVTLVIESDRWDAPDAPPRLVDVLPGDHSESLWGVAIDIGTTTNVVWLVDLLSGQVMAQVADYNGQIARGEDVISRIIYASKGKGQDKGKGLVDLQFLVIQTLNRLLEQAASQVGIQPAEIYRAVVAGNSTMIHLFVGLQPEPIRLEPFVTTINHVPILQAIELGLNICPDASVDTLPGIASYVGADITAGVVSTGMNTSDKLTLFIDVGTNGEIVLGDCTWLISCACSAGPAFEGAGVVHGMRATQGAIEEVWIDPQTYEPTIQVIGAEGEKPRGLCGSGLIGLMAELFITGVVDKGGHINATLETERTRVGAHGPEYVVAWANESATGEDIVITDVDLDNLMRAKAAIYAGFSILASSVGLTIADVEQVFIGGAFGQYINIEKAIQIGLLPDAPWDTFHYMGNTSVLGAYLSLLSRETRQQVVDIAAMMTYLELSADNTFFEEFSAALFLPHTDESQFPTVMAQLAGVRSSA